MSAADILIVEHAQAVAEELKRRLQKLGYRVVDIAFSGEEVIEKTKKLHPHVVLMNVRLKGTKDGIETGSFLRDTYDIPIVYMVDYARQETIRRVGTTGPFGYIFQPFDEKQIFATIETALIRHQLESKLRQSRQWLNTTLTSIGDGVIATDEQGLIRFINPVAMEHTCWNHTSAIGRSLKQVFIFVDELSQEPIDILEVHKRRGESSKNEFKGLLTPREGVSLPIEANLTSIKDGKGKIYGMVLIFRDVSQQRNALQEITRQADRAEALLQVASRLNSHLELKTVLNTICEITNRTIKATGTVVLLQSKQKEVFRAMAGISQDPEMKTERGTPFEVRRDFLETLLSRKNPVVVMQDIQGRTDLPYPEILKRFDVRTLALSALFRGAELIGAFISVFAWQPKSLPEDEVALLRGLADQASSAIENAELFDQIFMGLNLNPNVRGCDLANPSALCGPMNAWPVPRCTVSVTSLPIARSLVSSACAAAGGK